MANIMNRFFFLVLIIASELVFVSPGVESASTNVNIEEVTKIGAIVDANSQMGKQAITAMKIAVQNFNSDSRNHKLSLQIRDHNRDPFQAAMAAQELINKEKVKVIAGMETWEETAVVAEIASRVQVPILSFAAPAVTPLSMSRRWPYLIRMASNDSEQMKCIADLARKYNWRRVAAIYEDNVYGGDSGKLALLAEALQNVSSSEIQSRLVLPPISSISDPKEAVRGELKKVQDKQSRVFIVLQASLDMTIHLFTEANRMGLVGKDSVWIVTNTVANALDSLNTTVISSMEGTLGIKSYYSDDSSPYKEFSALFRRNFTSEYPEEDHFHPSIHALRAHDSIKIITEAIGRLNYNISSPEMLLRQMLSSDFSGLSGKIRFKDGELLNADTLRIVNVVGKKYKELDFWLPNFGFSKTSSKHNVGDISSNIAAEGFTGPVIWPGNLINRNPKGWAMPSNQEPMRIGVPTRTFFEKFVVIKDDPLNGNSNDKNLRYDGFSIELFRLVVDHLNYDLPYEFVPHDGVYDDLINGVYDKTYDAAVGDLTILGNRTEYVEFTQPYAESGFSMIVPAKQEESTWMFTKPFTWEMWMVTAASFIYTMFIVWLLEHQSNPEFRGTLKDQISNILWFAFSTIFFSHRANIQSNLTRVVVVLWLFVVFILTSSYTASLSSLLTVRRLEPNVTDIQSLKSGNLKVGCVDDSFVKKYLEEVLGFRSGNIVPFGNTEANYIQKFENNTIDSLFLERPYEKVFLDKYCKKYTAINTYRFGGLGFAFQRGSPIALDISRAILDLSEDGRLKTLEEEWFKPSSECSADERYSTRPENLTLHSFWGLYIVYGATSIFCFLLFVIRLLNNSWSHQETYQGNIAAWNIAARLARYIHNRKGTINNPARVSALGLAPPALELSSSRWEYKLSPTHPPENLQVELQMHE